MRKILRWSTIALFLISLAPIAEGAAKPVALHGVITQVAGAVQVIGLGVGELPLASPFQVIRAGVTVRVPEGGAAGIVCSSLRFVRLRGPASWSLTEPACAVGKELTPAEYALIAPRGGRFRVVEGLLVLEREIRSGHDDDPLAPVVLSPRNTVVRSPRPAISWSRVPSATSYRLEWRGRGMGDGIELRAGDIACPEDPEGMAVCSLPWPADRPDLPPGGIFFLRIAAQSGIAATWRSNDPVEVRTQSLAAASTLEQQLRDLERLGLEGPALDVAKAGLLAQKGLLADAAGLYQQALAAIPSPESRVTVADLYLSMGLHFLAEPRYREALTDAAPAIRAATVFGLGRIAYSHGNYQEATAFFRQARELYAQLRLGEEESAARQAEKTAEARSISAF